jgi:hypothetical protein
MRALRIACLPVLLLAACAEPQVPVVHQVRFRVTADDNTPVAAARIVLDGDKVLGETGTDGTLLVEIQAPEGLRLGADAGCPDGYLPGPPTTVSLRSHQRLDSKSDEAPEVSLRCSRTNRIAAVAIRAGGQAGLPIMLLGREIARTDASGVAHTMFRMPPGATFRLTIDTSSDPSLRPKSPSVTFTVPDRDDALIFDQPFEKILPPPKPRKRRAPPPPGPDRPFAIVSNH